MKSKEQLRQILEDLGVEDDKIVEVTNLIDETKPPVTSPANATSTIEQLENQLIFEQDWRKRAQISAQIIKLRLDT